MTPSEAAPSDAQYFELGDFELQSGEVLHSARLAYQALGNLRDDRRNAVLFPTYYTGTHRDNAKLVQSGRALDPAEWFVVIPNAFGNGLSSSPSNHPTQGGAAFPRVSLLDNVRAQQRLLNEKFGIERVALALGWSLGAQQAYHHAALFPERVESLLAVCGSARTAPHNWVFLAGVKAALLADPAFLAGHYREPPLGGLGAFGRVYAGWAYSQAFFRNHEYRELGHDSPEALLEAWALDHRARDANDLLCLLHSWQNADISDNPLYQGDFTRALRAITARAIIMPVAQDLYFHPDDNRLEVAHLPSAELRVIESTWGHVAGGPDRNPRVSALIDAAIRDLLGPPGARAARVR
ncbi:MAG TPA: alpha/beta fold hydrolase [Polyangiaceae bacterium]|nr:alpha/beta fold hydrolase [Polyangiaceae bacterium]